VHVRNGEDSELIDVDLELAVFDCKGDVVPVVVEVLFED
jgi:hypothetical protein